MRAEAESAGIDTLASASADSVATETSVHTPSTDDESAGSRDGTSLTVMQVLMIVAVVPFAFAVLLSCVCRHEKKQQRPGDVLKLEETSRQIV